MLIGETSKLHNKFFANFSQLSLSLRKLHAIKMEELTVQTALYYRVDFKKPKNLGNYEDRFWQWLKCYHLVLYRVVTKERR